MKWIGINNLGCTWEPKEHFVGADAEEKLKQYINSIEVEAENAEKWRQDILAGKLVVTGKPAEEPAPAEPPSNVPAMKTECAFSRTRKNAQVFGAISMAGLVTRKSSTRTTPRRQPQRDRYAACVTCMFSPPTRLICVRTCNPHTKLWSLKSREPTSLWRWVSIPPYRH